MKNWLLRDHFKDSLASHFLCSRADDPFRRRVPKLSINCEEILSRARGTFEEQIKALEPSMIIIIIIINYCIFISTAVIIV